MFIVQYKSPARPTIYPLMSRIGGLAEAESTT
jgi:hypothetical protein